MATLDLGKIKFTWKAAYSGATAYEPDDVVSYNANVYICKLASTGNVPTNTTYWDVMLEGVNILTTLGDLATHNGSGPVRFGLGANGNVLTATSTGVQWQPPSGLEGTTFLTNPTQTWMAAPNLVGTGNETWLGDPAGNNLGIRAALPNPQLRARRWGGHAYHGCARMSALNNKYEQVGMGDQAYGVIGHKASSDNKYVNAPFYDFQGECGLLRDGDYFVQHHFLGSSASVVALTKDGDVWFKGYNAPGWAGNGHTTDCYGWVKVPYLGPDASVGGSSCKIIGLTTTQVINGGAADNVTIFAIDSSYRLWTWGYNGNGECGIGNTTTPQTTPQLVTALSNVRMVVAGLYSVYAVTNSGQLYSWGYNNQGQLGLGNTSTYTSPQIVTGATDVYDIHTHHGSWYSGGWNYYYQAYYLKNNGELYGTGYNSQGNLGNGTTTQQNAFVRCNPTLTFSEFTTTGDAQYCSVAAIGGVPGTPDGKLYAWGYNGNGQLGNASTTNSSTAVRPDTTCDQTRNRTKTYIAGVMSDSARVFPRDNIVKIAPYCYGASSSGFFVWDSTGRMYIMGYGYYFSTYRTDQGGYAYTRPCLMPSPWSGEGGSATPYSYDVVGWFIDCYEYSPSYMMMMQTSDGRIWWMGTDNEGYGHNNVNLNGRWQQWTVA